MLIRLIHRIINEPHGGFIYVDDMLILAPESRMPQIAALVQLVLAAIGTPMSWHKTSVGFELEYLGFCLDLRRARIGIPQRKFEKASEFLETYTCFCILIWFLDEPVFVVRDPSS